MATVAGKRRNAARLPIGFKMRGEAGVSRSLHCDFNQPSPFRPMCCSRISHRGQWTGGVGWAQLCQINPRLLYASDSGCGLSGPDRDNLAMYLTIQAVSGLISATGSADGPPLKAGPAVVDCLSGIHLYAAVTPALFECKRTRPSRAAKPGRVRASN